MISAPSTPPALVPQPREDVRGVQAAIKELEQLRLKFQPFRREFEAFNDNNEKFFGFARRIITEHAEEINRARQLCSQPGRRIKIEGIPTFSEWCQENLPFCSMRYVQQQLKKWADEWQEIAIAFAEGLPPEPEHPFIEEEEEPEPRLREKLRAAARETKARTRQEGHRRIYESVMQIWAIYQDDYPEWRPEFEAMERKAKVLGVAK